MGFVTKSTLQSPHLEFPLGHSGSGDTLDMVAATANAYRIDDESANAIFHMDTSADATYFGTVAVDWDFIFRGTGRFAAAHPFLLLREAGTADVQDAGILVQNTATNWSGIFWDNNGNEWAVSDDVDDGAGGVPDQTGNVTINTYGALHALNFIAGGSVRLAEQAGDPANVANSGFVYTKDVGAVTELFYEDSGGAVSQITSAGVVGGIPHTVATHAVDTILTEGTTGVYLSTDDTAATETIRLMPNDTSRIVHIGTPASTTSIDAWLYFNAGDGAASQCSIMADGDTDDLVFAVPSGGSYALPGTGAGSTMGGLNAVASSGDSTAFGNGCIASTGTGATSYGENCVVTGVNSVGAGRNVSIAHSASAGFGGAATSTANNQLILGGAVAPFLQTYLGGGVASAAPFDVVLQTTGGNANTVTGADFTLAGSVTVTGGAGVGGNLIWQTAITDTLIERMQIDNTGLITMGPGGGTPLDVTLRGAPASGTDTAGSGLTLAIGAGTGNGDPSTLKLQVAFESATGSTPHPLRTFVELDGTDFVAGANIKCGQMILNTELTNDDRARAFSGTYEEDGAAAAVTFDLPHAPAAETAGYVRVDCVGWDATAGEMYAATMLYAYENDGGVLAEKSETTIVEINEGTWAGVSASISGTRIRIQLSGDVTNTVNWAAHWTQIEAGT